MSFAGLGGSRLLPLPPAPRGGRCSLRSASLGTSALRTVVQSSFGCRSAVYLCRLDVARLGPRFAARSFVDGRGLSTRRRLRQGSREGRAARRRRVSKDPLVLTPRANLADVIRKSWPLVKGS